MLGIAIVALELGSDFAATDAHIGDSGRNCDGGGSEDGQERKREWRMVIYRAWGTQGDERAKECVFRYIDVSFGIVTDKRPSWSYNCNCRDGALCNPSIA